MAPGIVGVDAARERGQLGIEAGEIVEVGCVQPGSLLVYADALMGAPGIRQLERRVAGLERQPQLGHQLGVGGLPLGGELSPELHGAAVGQDLLLHAPSGALARLQHDHVGARANQVARSGEPGETGAGDHNVVF